MNFPHLLLKPHDPEASHLISQVEKVEILREVLRDLSALDLVLAHKWVTVFSLGILSILLGNRRSEMFLVKNSGVFEILRHSWRHAWQLML